MEVGGVKWEDLKPSWLLGRTGRAENGEKGSLIGSCSGAGDIEIEGIENVDERQDIEKWPAQRGKAKGRVRKRKDKLRPRSSHYEG